MVATYVYDDFRVVMTSRPDGRFDVAASPAGGPTVNGEFAVPFTPEDLGTVVEELARGHDGGREVAIAGDVADDEAQRLGTLLADALLSGPVGEAYDHQRAASEGRGRGLRLTLSLGKAPALLDLPWELLYRRPRFIASQRQTPVVRHLGTGNLAVPPAIDGTVRILGLIADCTDLPRLDVTDERARVDRAVAKMVDDRRVELTWLDPATPRALREALRDGSFHILHYVGHSSFTSAGEGAIYLPGDDGHAVAVDSEMLAMLLGDQQQLRLVVLNSCKGARTTVNDPYAGVATTLVHLGVPAVIAMQFAISDRAARVFAEELYTSLIGRQFPIDAAMAEARKAIFVEIDQIEWATPVLFLRDPDVQLFDFALPAADLPPPPPPALPVPVDREPPAEPPPPSPPSPSTTPDEPAETSFGKRRSGTSTTLRVVLGLFGLIALVLVLILVSVVVGGGDGGTGGGTTTVTQVAGPQPRAHAGYVVAQVLEPDRETHLYNFLRGSSELGNTTDRGGVTDAQPSADRTTNRVAFTRVDPQIAGSAIKYVVPKEDGHPTDSGKQVAALVPHTAGSFDHFPAWGDEGTLYYLHAEGCAPGPGCDESLRFASFDATSDGEFLDALTFAGEEEISNGFQEVSAIAVNLADASQVAISDADGLWFVDGDGTSQLIVPGLRVPMLAFTPDGRRLVAIGAGSSTRQAVVVVDASTGRQLAASTVSAGSSVTSIATGDADQQLLALAGNGADELVLVMLQVGDDASLTRLDAATPIPRVVRQGTPQAIGY
jgi:CHAT domain